MDDENRAFRKTGMNPASDAPPVRNGTDPVRQPDDGQTGRGRSSQDDSADDAAAGGSVPFSTLEPRRQLELLLKKEIQGKPFSELFGVTLDHRGSVMLGHILLDTLEENGFGVGDFDAVGALTPAAVPLVAAVIQAAASRGQDVDGFVMDFVYPSVKGPSISGRRVILLDSWLSEKSYVQTSSLVTLRNGNELNLDFGVVRHENATVVAVASLVGGFGGSDSLSSRPRAGRTGERPGHVIDVVNPVDSRRETLPFVQVFDEHELRGPEE
jgi:hypothetical protein